ncbi:hypothetical protein K438DRAFT_1765992 [Mycena galopus ATCC 62051]|nr:hypothetical protein K438DRAFT_1765992 [Mycena galopus ATCC 62051]
MTNLTYNALIVCLLASNVGRPWRLLSWIRSLLRRPLEPQLIPYFDEQGNLIGLVRVPMGFNERNARLPAYTHPRDQTLDTNISVARRSGAEYSDHETKSLPRVAFDSTEGKLDSAGWNCWPDGNFERMFDWDEMFKTHGLATNWVVETLGHRGGMRHAIAALEQLPATTDFKCRDVRRIPSHGSVYNRIANPW